MFTGAPRNPARTARQRAIESRVIATGDAVPPWHPCDASREQRSVGFAELESTLEAAVVTFYLSWTSPSAGGVGKTATSSAS